MGSAVSGRSIRLVTGASRGIGRAIAVELALPEQALSLIAVHASRGGTALSRRFGRQADKRRLSQVTCPAKRMFGRWCSSPCAVSNGLTFWCAMRDCSRLTCRER